MDTAEIRRRFVAHFEAAGHTAVPSASLLADDPNLLFVNAGMVPFKPYFLGQETPPWPRATSVQKCVRTPDIEDVGKTTRHGTFFEMCGNFSFGDYFKEGAIELAWDLVTKPVADGGYGLDETSSTRASSSTTRRRVEPVEQGHRPPRRADRPPRQQGELLVDGRARPGGPCSEILYDRGPEYGRPSGEPACAELEDRYLEIWNLVFMQDELSAVRSKEDFDIAGSLPKKNIDTGMGLERVAFLLQGVDNMYEIDVMSPSSSGPRSSPARTYGADHERRRALPGRRRPRPHLDDADRRRRHARQRGPRLRPAPAAAPRGPLDAPARATRTAALPELLPISRDKMGETYTEPAPRLGAHLHAWPTPRRTRSAQTLQAGHRDLRPGRDRGEEGRRRRSCPATRRSRCTTPTASRST